MIEEIVDDATRLIDAETNEISNTETQNVNASAIEAYERGQTDINFFAGLCMPGVCTSALPLFYVAIWHILANRSPELLGKLLRFALGLPRGHAKTTFTKILIVWLIVYDKISFPLIVCSNEPLAVLILADIHDILSSPNLSAVYGDWQAGLIIDSADTKKAAYHNRSVVLVARGWAAGIRGLNIANQRPDMIFLDDVQTKVNDESPTDRAKLLQELTGTIFKAIAPAGNRFIVYLGNMYSEECMLFKFKKNKKWLSMITGAILENGEPLWGELHSLEDLMESYEHDEDLGLAHVWFAEVMNDPKSIATSLLHDPLPESPYATIEDPDGVFLTIDPAGFRKHSDDNVISVHYKFEQKGYIAARSNGIKDPSELIQEAIKLALFHGASLIAVEDTGYQQTLGFWITHFMKEWNVQGIAVVPVSHHGRSKETRIRQFIAELYRETYYIMEPAARRSFVWQASMYKIGKPNNRDDILDTDAYGLDVRNEYWHLITNLKRHAKIVESSCSVIGNNTCF